MVKLLIKLLIKICLLHMFTYMYRVLSQLASSLLHFHANYTFSSVLARGMILYLLTKIVIKV